MLREPRERDIVRVPGSSAPEIVIRVTPAALELGPLDGGATRVILRPWRQVIRLVGVASPRSHGKRSQAPRAPEPPPVAAPAPSQPEEPAAAVRGSYGSGVTAARLAELY